MEVLERSPYNPEEYGWEGSGDTYRALVLIWSLRNAIIVQINDA